MSLEADLIVDRVRLKRRLTRWRLLAVLAVAAAAGLGAALGGVGLSRPHVARLSIKGPIADEPTIVAALRRVLRDGSARALIVAIDSPGGTVSGGEALHQAIAAVAERKPVVAVMGGIAASAGYMVALPAARVFAREGTLTGSIGVIMQTFEASGLMARIGITAEALTSGALKGQPSPFRPLSEAGRASLSAIVADLHDQFVERVAVGRHMPEPAVRAIADGRAMTGRQALALGLVDAIGGEAEARAWLATERGIPESLPTRALAEPGPVAGLIADAAQALQRTAAMEWLRLDLPMALWQPR